MVGAFFVIVQLPTSRRLVSSPTAGAAFLCGGRTDRGPRDRHGQQRAAREGRQGRGAGDRQACEDNGAGGVLAPARSSKIVQVIR